MKKILPLFCNLICAVLCVSIVISGLFLVSGTASAESEKEDLQVITVWQADTFEGGRGSRAEYLRALGVKFSEKFNVYVEVTALSSDAVRKNFENGVYPDIISYGSGTYGIESCINERYDAKVWCRGGYCLLSLESDDFSAADGENTVINKGKDNLTMAAAMLCNLQGSDSFEPTNAYVKLINGEYKYLLGTQRDIVRLITRGVTFYVKPLTDFNDLYQNISVTSAAEEKGDICNGFINFITENSGGVSSLCMLCDGLNLYDNALKEMEDIEFAYTVPSVVSRSWREEVENAIKENNSDKLKSLLKSL